MVDVQDTVVTCLSCQGLADTGPAKHSGEESVPQEVKIGSAPKLPLESWPNCFKLGQESVGSHWSPRPRHPVERLLTDHLRREQQQER